MFSAEVLLILKLFSWITETVFFQLFFQSAHPYKYAGEKVDVQGLDIFKVRSEYKFAV